MSFDVHIHPWTRGFMRRNRPIMKACRFFNLDVAKLPATQDQLLDEMEGAGVAGGVILGQDTHATQNPAFKNYSLRNDDMAALARKSKDRLVPFAGVDPNAAKESVKE